MERTITIGGKKCRMAASAALPRIYRRTFRRDIFEDVGLLAALFPDDGDDGGKATEEQLDAMALVEDLAYIMHKHGDPSQPETVEEWLAQFDDPGAVFDALADVLLLWNGNMAQTAVAEKKTGRPTGK